jgi:hypothetical protein
VDEVPPQVYSACAVTPAGFPTLQSVVAVVVLCSLAVLASAYLAAAIGIALLVVALLLSRKYNRERDSHLAEIERLSGGSISQARDARNREDARAQRLWRAAGLLPIALAAVAIALDFCLLNGYERLVAGIIVGSLAVTAAAGFASSLVDWYYIVPRIAGWVHRPPCFPDSTQPDELMDVEYWKGVTRWWYIHRVGAASVSILGVGTAVVSGIVALVLLLITHIELTSVPEGVVIAAVGVGAAVVGALIRTAAGPYLNAVGPTILFGVNPHVAIGDFVRIPSKQLEHAYVVDVAIEGIKVISPSTRIVSRRVRPHRVPNALVGDGDVEPIPGEYCRDRCLFLNVEYCLYARHRCGPARETRPGETSA